MRVARDWWGDELGARILTKQEGRLVINISFEWGQVESLPLYHFLEVFDLALEATVQIFSQRFPGFRDSF